MSDRATHKPHVFEKSSVDDLLTVINQLFEELKAKLCKNFGIMCGYLCPHTLKHALQLCGKDISQFARGRNLHDGVAPTKQAAYIAKWIIKLRPIIIPPNCLDGLDEEVCDLETSWLLYANEHFALIVACAFMGIDFNKTNTEYAENFAYNYHKHGVKSVRQLFLEFELLTTLHA